jgi:hypothetical protein
MATISPQLIKRDAVSLPAIQTQAVPRWGFPEWFVISQTALPAILYLPNTQALRLPIRVSSFGISLAALIWWLGKRTKNTKPHPAAHWLLLAVICLALMIFHPTTNTTMAGLAQTMLYLSVLAPAFWASEMIRSPQRLMRLLVILLVCNGINSLVGVLQVYNPRYWMPEEFSSVVLSMKYGLSNYTYVNSAGQLAVRPTGLFDTPGAVCGPGMVAGVLGLIFALSPIAWWKRLLALGASVTGVAAVYYSQVRTGLLIMAAMMLVYAGIIWFIQKQKTRAIVFLGVGGLLLTVLFSFTIARSGAMNNKRFEALTQGNPIAVYYQAKRGDQLENAFTTLLPQYPLGAGLGRWGMMRLYFGDESNLDSPLIWAELQFPAWILDGGIILMGLYGLALFATTLYEFRIAKKSRNTKLGSLVPIVIAINMGTLALVFGFTPFTTQLGLQYWFLAGALHGVAQSSGLFLNERIRTGQRGFHNLGRDGSRQL